MRLLFKGGGGKNPETRCFGDLQGPTVKVHVCGLGLITGIKCLKPEVVWRILALMCLGCVKQHLRL